MITAYAYSSAGFGSALVWQHHPTLGALALATALVAIRLATARMGMQK